MVTWTSKLPNIIAHMPFTLGTKTIFWDTLEVKVPLEELHSLFSDLRQFSRIWGGRAANTADRNG